jgi:hypothetical protein
MSGRGRVIDADQAAARLESATAAAAAERAALREVTREAHEALAEGRRVLAEIETAVNLAVSHISTQGLKALDACRQAVSDRLDELGRRVGEGLPIRIACPGCGGVQTYLMQPGAGEADCLTCHKKFWLGLPPDSPMIGDGPPDPAAWRRTQAKGTAVTSLAALRPVSRRVPPDISTGPAGGDYREGHE